MLNIVLFGAAVLEKKSFKAYPYISLCKSLNHWCGPYIILGTSFEQLRISLPEGCSLQNINAFWLVVHEKIFEVFYYIKLLVGPHRA